MSFANIFSHEVRNAYHNYTDVKYQLISTLPNQYKKGGNPSLWKNMHTSLNIHINTLSSAYNLMGFTGSLNPGLPLAHKT